MLNQVRLHDMTADAIDFYLVDVKTQEAWAIEENTA